MLTTWRVWILAFALAAGAGAVILHGSSSGRAEAGRRADGPFSSVVLHDSSESSKGQDGARGSAGSSGTAGQDGATGAGVPGSKAAR